LGFVWFFVLFGFLVEFSCFLEKFSFFLEKVFFVEGGFFGESVW